MIDSWTRYQKGLTLNHLFPKVDGVCACGCEEQLTGRRKKWASNDCRDNSYVHFAILKGDNELIRYNLFERDEGFCQVCGVFDNKWQADHIKPVHQGGGACGLDNFQTICIDCHKEKTKNQMLSHRAKISSQAAPSEFIISL